MTAWIGFAVGLIIGFDAAVLFFAVMSYLNDKEGQSWKASSSSSR